MSDICKSVKSLSIIKIIIKNINPNELENKFIFVGYRMENIVKLLTKLEKHETLNNKEKTELEADLPYYITKFGDLDKYNIYFIYNYLEENLNINHAKILIYESIKERLGDIIGAKINDYQPHNFLMYKYFKNLNYKGYINMLNYVFEKNTELTNDDFFNRLYKITYLTKTQINEKLKKVLINKYKDVNKEDSINFVSKTRYIYNECLNSDDLYHLCIETPIILTTHYNYTIDGDINIYYGYQNINYILDIVKDHGKEKIKDIKFFIEYTLNNNYNILSHTLLYFNKTRNNEYFIVTYNEIKDILPKNMIDFYFSHKEISTKITSTQYENIYENIYNKFKLTIIKKHLYDDNILVINDCYCRNIIFDSLSNNLNIEYDLKNLYNNISTNYYRPVIKYVSNDEVKYIKLNKNFLLKHTYQEINSLLINTNLLKNISKYNISRDYIQHKWRISKTIILTINFYNNGYTIVYFDDDNNLRLSDTLQQYLKLVPLTIKYIKKIINAKELILPNISNIFNEYTNKLNYSTLLNGNIIINSKLDILKLQTKEELLKNNNKLDVLLFIQRLSIYFNKYHQFIVNKGNKISINALHIFYKQVNNFYNDDNIINFLRVSAKRGGDHPSKDFLNNLFKICESIFFINNDKIKKLYDNINNLPTNLLKIEETLLYGIELELTIDNNGIMELKFSNVDKYYSVKLILFYVKNILSNIAYDIKTGILTTDDVKYVSSIPKDKTIKHDNMYNDLDMLDLYINLDATNKLDIDGDKTLKGIDTDMDLKNLAKLIQFEKNPIDKQQDSTEYPDVYKHIELVKMFGRNKKINFTKYMNQMREVYDKQLFFPDINGVKKFEYGRACQVNEMKQPYIVTKKDIDSYDDPEAFNGYIKYRNNYYICPRLWDYKANKPISVKKFIENGYKSPYSGGIAIPPEHRKTIELNDKYTVIIRKPTTVKSSMWEDATKYPHWPQLLKKTEKEAYPYLMAPTFHPQKLCVPCCGSKKPEDFDPNKQKIQQIFKPTSDKMCRNKLLEEANNYDNKDHNVKIHEKEPSILCSSSIELSYITNDVSDLEKCRCGLLPKNLDIILNNHQGLFLKNQTQLMDNCNLFLRIGVESNKKDNILETFSVIYKMTLQGLKNLLVNKLTPDVFIMLNNGELVDIYSSNNILPNSLSDYDKFAEFMKNYVIFFNILDIDYEILEKVKYKDIEFLNYHIEDNTKFTNYINNSINTKKNIANDLHNIKKLIIAYKFYSAFYNYIGHILNEHEYKNYTHFLDLFSKPIEWLNRDGANILIFDKTATKLYCNPYINIYRKKYIILIHDNKNHFVPIIHINNVHKNSPWDGIFSLDKININDITFNYFEKHITNKNMLLLTKQRREALINLLIIHLNICKYQYQQQTQLFIKELNDNNIKPINQIVFTTTQIEFIKLDNNYNNLLIPIYPTAINAKQMDNKFTLLTIDKLNSLENYIIYDYQKTENTNTLENTVSSSQDNMSYLKMKLYQYNYRISKIFYDEITNMINSIQFVNNLVVPVKPEKYTLARQNEIINLLIKHGEMKNLDDPRITSLFRPSYFDFQLEISPQKDILNIRNSIYKDFIYNYFKYDFSRLLQENTYKNNKQNIEKNILEKHYYDLQDILDELYDNVFNIMNTRITLNNKPDTTTNKHKNVIKLKVCNKTKKQDKCDGIFCKFDNENKQCYLDMNIKQLQYFSYLLANDLINNKLEARDIIKGSFIPEFNMRNKIFRNPDEIIINPAELANIIESGIYSKFKKNLTLSEYLNNEKEYIFSKHDYEILEHTNIDEFKQLMNTLIPEIVDLSIKNIFIDDKIFTTPFNKDGIYDTSSTIGECKFPFFDKNKKKYVYQCIPRKNGIMCPTKLDYKRTPNKLGFCPEKLLATRQSLNVIDIDTSGDHYTSEKNTNNVKEYYEGKCLFPYINKETINNETIYKLKYDCMENKTKVSSFTWCPLRTLKQDANYNKQYNINKDLLRAADKFDSVQFNKWYDGKLNLSAINTKKYKKGYCQPPLTKKKNIKVKNNDTSDQVLTIENYIPTNCSVKLTQSKGGYNKLQLFNFGVNYLKIPHNQLYKNNNIILPKAELCKLINNKYRDVIMHSQPISDKDRLNAYFKSGKNLDNCVKGESKGGYSLQKLKELAINYYNLTQEQVNTLDKTGLCAHITKVINSIINKQDDDDKHLKEHDEYKFGINEKHHIKHEYNMIYPYDINLCKETPNRGGIGNKELKNIATRNFGINIKSKHKDVLCNEIENKLNAHHKHNNVSHSKKTHINSQKNTKKIFNNLNNMDNDIYNTNDDNTDNKLSILDNKNNNNEN